MLMCSLSRKVLVFKKSDAFVLKYDLVLIAVRLDSILSECAGGRQQDSE